MARKKALSKEETAVLCSAIAAISVLLVVVIPSGNNAASNHANGAVKSAVVSFQSGARLFAEVADTPEERRTGLMFRDSLPEGRGMLFVFDEDSVRTFWMKNTRIPLDMIFINSSLDVVSIQRNAQPCLSDPCATYSSHLPVRYVVEANAGFADANGIREGTKVSVYFLQ